jgi:hypothetical protein
MIIGVSPELGRQGLHIKLLWGSLLDAYLKGFVKVDQ